MPSSTECWGIEIGASAIKAIRLEKSGKDISLTDFDLIPYKKVLTTPDLDVEETIRVGLDQFLSRHSLGKASVVVSVPGHKAFARFAKLPPVEPKRVPDIVKFEAVQQIPFPIEEVEWDYQTFQHPDSPDVEVGIFAITKERVFSWLSNFEAMDIQVHGLTLAPIAVYNAMAHDLEIGEDAPGTVLMDIGTSATDLIILEGGRIWLRTIPIGGHHFTEALVRSFKLSYSKAERIKREAATSKYAKQIFQAMRPVFVDLVSEVQKSLGFYQSMSRDSELTKLIGLGSTFRLPGLKKFLKQQLQMDVTRLDKFNRIEAEGRSASSFAENTLSFAPAYGLALQGLEQEKVTCNILPSDMVHQQVWKAKQPWAVAAAALIAAAAVLSYTRLWYDRRAYESNDAIQSQIETVLNEADRKTARLNEVADGADPRARIENLRRVLDYRRVWPLVLTDIQNAMASVDPQEELLSGNPEAIQTINRSDRRQVEIESIEHEYVYNSSNDPTATEAWGERRYVDAADAEEVESGSSSSLNILGGGYGMEEEEEGDGLPPSYLITVEGTTPNSQAPTFLNSTFVRWLEQKEAEMEEQDDRHQEDPENNPPRERPYRILQVDMEVEPILESENRRQSARRGGRNDRNQRDADSAEETDNALQGVRNLPGTPDMNNRRGRSGRSLPGSGGRGGYDQSMEMERQMREMMEGGYGGMDMPGMYGGQMGGRRSGGRSNLPSTGELAELMPSDPLAEEDDAGDWRFVIRWRIELVPPEEARRITPETQPDTPDEPLRPVAEAEDLLP